jgi:hypothetical protein
VSDDEVVGRWRRKAAEAWDANYVVFPIEGNDLDAIIRTLQRQQAVIEAAAALRKVEERAARDDISAKARRDVDAAWSRFKAALDLLPQQYPTTEGGPR